jgi:miniconductance mechanosensitive channel
MEEWLTALREGRWLAEIGGLSIVLVVAIGVYFIARWAFLRIVRRFASATRTHWDDELVRAGVFSRLAFVAPAFVVYFGIGLFPDFSDRFVAYVHRVVIAIMVLVGALAFTSLLSAVERIYDGHEEYRQRPIKSYLQVFSILVYLITGVLAVSVLMNRSPWLFVSGIGAMTAVLLLVFRDTILSFVASLQIASNDMVRVGDWIEMPDLGADGDVIELALHTVKDRNVRADLRRLTNLGTFRAWIWATLRKHPKIHQAGHTLLVRQLPSGPQGVPIEIYCFANDTNWVAYEEIQADLFDRILAMVPEFGLRVYQQPAGSDVQALGSFPRTQEATQ